MEFLAEGFRSLERHWRIVAMYTGLSLVVAMSIHTWQAAMLQKWLGPIDDSTIRITDFAIMVIGTTIGAGIQTIYFAQLGRAIDRPLFKVDGPLDALRRFFTTWLLLNLLLLGIIEIFKRLAVDGHPAAGGLVFFYVVAYVLYVPIGACIMFHGGAPIGDAVSPMTRLFPQTAAVIFLRLFAFSLEYSFAPFVVPTVENTTAWLVGAPALITMMVLLECVSFAAMWEICKSNRDLGDEDDDMDF